MAIAKYSNLVPPREKRERQLNVALRQAGLTVFDWDLARGRVSWAGCHEEMFGIPPDLQFDDTYEHMLSFVHPEDVARVDQVTRDLIARGDSYSIEYRILRPDGELRWVSGTGELERDGKGHAARVVGVIRDITPARDADRQRDRARDLLYQLLQGSAERQALVDTLYGTAPVGLAFLDGDLRFVRINQHLARINALPAEQHIGHRMSELFGEPGRAIEQVLSRVLATGEPELDVRLPIPHPTLPGITRLFSASFHPVRAESGEILGVGAVVIEVAPAQRPAEPASYDDTEPNPQDARIEPGLVPSSGGHDWHMVEIWREVADRKQAVEALRKSEERLRLSTSAAGVGVFEWDLRSDAATWENDRMFEILGHSREHGPISRTDFLAQYLVPEDVEPFSRALVEAAQAKQPFKTISRCRRKDGALRWLEFAGEFEFAPNGTPHRMIGVVTDITDRRQAEETLQRLYALTDAALAHMDMETLLAELLARIRQLLSTDSAQILLLSADGTSLSVVAADGLLEDDRDARIPVGQGLAGRIAKSRTPLVIHNTRQVSALSPVLRDRLTSVMGVPLFVEGRLIGVLHTGTARPRHFDDNDLSLLQAAADRAALAIEHVRLYAEARTLIDQLQRSNAVKDELLGLVSHELRTPMTTIMGTIEVLAQRFESLDAASRGAAFSELRNDAARLERIIRNMLILARGDSLWETDPEPVMLQHVLREVVQSEQPRDESRPLVLSMAPGLPPVLASVGYLEQILENLLTNARKYGAPGTSIEIRAQCRDEMVSVTVADRGPILAGEEVAQFFEPFYRSERVKNRSGGTGLGMSVCRRLVEVLGGTIAARPRQGGGLVVTFSLPAIHPDETA